MELVLDLRPDLVASISNGVASSITTSAYYKINLKRYVSYTTEDQIYFQSGLSYINMKTIVDVFQKASSMVGYSITISPQITEYISAKELHLETRSRLGIEIKKQDEKLLQEYNKFCAVVNASMTRTLRDKQMWDSFFMTSMKKSCNFSVPGSGKTSSVYGMFSFLKNRGIINKIIVICPKNAFGPWIDEFHSCFGEKEQLHLFNIQEYEGSSKLKRKASIKYDTGTSNLLLFNYECIKSYACEIKSIIDTGTLLVFDEVHKVKRVNGEYANAAIDIAQKASYIVAMTGTPIPNTYQDIYNLLHILYGEEYNDFFSFQANGLQKPSRLTVEKVNKKLQPFFCRTTKHQLGVPLPNSDTIIPVPASDNELRIFRVLSQKYKKNKLLLMLRILQLESKAEQLLTKLDLSEFQYILNEDVKIDEIDYADYSEELKTCIMNCHTSSKTAQCINLVKGLNIQRKPVIIWCIYVSTIKNLASLLTKEGIKVKCVYGEVDLTERQNLLSGFKSHEYDVLITNPNTLAESVSLHTVCHDAIYFEYSFNLVHLLQSKDRIHRLGLPDDQYTQFYFLHNVYSLPREHYSMGEHIYNRLSSKEEVMLKAIDSDLLEIMPTTQEELDSIFGPLLGY